MPVLRGYWGQKALLLGKGQATVGAALSPAAQRCFAVKSLAQETAG